MQPCVPPSLRCALAPHTHPKPTSTPAARSYLTALIMTTAHDAAASTTSAEVIENLIVFCLVLGLLLGALLGWCWLL